MAVADEVTVTEDVASVDESGDTVAVTDETVVADNPSDSDEDAE